MSEEMTEPLFTIGPDGTKLFNDPPVLLHRMSLVIATLDVGLRAELWEWRPGMKPNGHVVWQHHTRYRHDHNIAPTVSKSAMGSTALWLDQQGWPGVKL